MTLADEDVPLWEMNSSLIDFIADVSVDVNMHILFFAFLFSTSLNVYITIYQGKSPLPLLRGDSCVGGQLEEGAITC